MAKNKNKKNLDPKPAKVDNNSGAKTEEAGADNNDKLKELESKLLSSLAENENLRKRFDREKEDLSNYVISNFAKEILSVLDNLQRAMASVNSNEAKDKSDGLSQLIEGIELTEKQIISTFEKKDLQDTLLEQQDALIKLWNWVHQPLPFPYVNLVITMDMVYLLLYSFLKGLVAYDRDIFTLPIIAVFILTISTLGLIRLSLMMNDPFSHEDWALRVGALCTSTILDANAMLSSRHREVVDDLHDILDDNEIAEAQELIVRKKLEEHLNQKENQKVYLN